MVCGWTSSEGAGGSDAWMFKVTNEGIVDWSATYGGTRDDAAYYLAQCSDGGYVLTGPTASFGSGLNDFFVLKTDCRGNTVGVPEEGR